MILQTEVRETPTSCNSRLVDFRGDPSKQALTFWTSAGVIAVKGGPLCSLLLFLTVPVYLNFSTRALIVLRCGIFLPEKSHRNCLWTRRRKRTIYLLLKTRTEYVHNNIESELFILSNRQLRRDHWSSSQAATINQDTHVGRTYK